MRGDGSRVKERIWGVRANTGAFGKAIWKLQKLSEIYTYKKEFNEVIYNGVDSTPARHLILFVFLVTTVLRGRYHWKVSLICMSLMPNETEHLFVFICYLYPNL